MIWYPKRESRTLPFIFQVHILMNALVYRETLFEKKIISPNEWDCSIKFNKSVSFSCTYIIGFTTLRTVVHTLVAYI